MVYITLFQSILLVVIFLLYFRARRDLVISNLRIQGLSTNEKNNVLKRSTVTYYIGENRRQNFRVSLEGVECLIELLNFEDKRLKRLTHKKVKGSIDNISIGGTKFTCDIDLPVKTSISINISFILEDQEFSLNGEIIRKEEYIKTNSFGYGAQFNQLSGDDEKTLSITLNKLIMEKK